MIIEPHGSIFCCNYEEHFSVILILESKKELGDHFSSLFPLWEKEKGEKNKTKRKEEKENEREHENQLVIPDGIRGITSHRKGFMVLIAVSRNYAASLGASVCKK